MTGTLPVCMDLTTRPCGSSSPADGSPPSPGSAPTRTTWCPRTGSTGSEEMSATWRLLFKILQLYTTACLD